MSSSTNRPVRTIALVGALAASAALVGLPGTADAAQDVAAKAAQVGATTPVKWGTCPAATLAGVPADRVKLYSCATYPMPIDHDNSALGTIGIALMKRSALRPDKKIGSLFLNPGGPGGSGLSMAVTAGGMFQALVLDRFDSIGFDPRGVGASNPLRCFTTKEDADKVLD